MEIKVVLSTKWTTLPNIGLPEGTSSPRERDRESVRMAKGELEERLLGKDSA